MSGKARPYLNLLQTSVTAGVQRFGQCSFNFTCAYAQRLVGITTTLTLAVIRQAGTSRDQATHDNVFFQAAQVIALAGYRRFGQYASGLSKEAAEMNDSVDSDALVIPSRTRVNLATNLSSVFRRSFSTST